MDPFWTPSLEDVKQYFSNEEWAKLTDYDKKNYINILENYNIMVDLDMNPEKPDFIKAWIINSASENKNKTTHMEVDEIKQTSKEVENKLVGNSDKSADMTTADSSPKKAKSVKRRGRKRKTTTAPVLEVEETSIGTSPSEHSGSTLESNKKQPNKPDIVEPFTQEEILKAVQLDNTVGALYDYCLSELFKERCAIGGNTASTSSGSKPSSTVKIKAEKPDSILKYLADLGFTKEKLSEDHKHIYCSPCQRFYDFFCPRGHRIPIRDLPSDPPGTPAQFPKYLAIGNSGVPEAGVGVWSTAIVEKGVVWGPFKDSIIPEISDNERERRTAHDRIQYLLKNFAIIKRTWNTLINCARHEGERNVVWFKHKGEVYYKVCKRIPQATEVLMFYTKEDIEKMGIDLCKFSIGVLEVPKIGIVVECTRCSSLFSNSRFLLRHKKVCDPKLPDDTYFNKKTEIPKKSIEEDVSKDKTESNKLTINKRSHTGERTFICDICNKGFTRPNHLTTHKLVHTGEKPFICDICNKGFTQSGSLATHKLVHTGEKPFICDICNKGCTTSGHLTKHKRIHTGERPFICDICNKGFTNFSHLTTHKRSLH